MGAAAASFKRGFRKAGWFSLASALILSIFILVYVNHLVETGTIWMQQPRLLYSGVHDDIAHVNYLVNECAHDSTDIFKLLVLSASSTREAILDRDYVNPLLSRGVGRNSTLYNMSMSSESYAESLQIIEQLEGKILHGAIALGTSPFKLFYGRDEDYRMAAEFERLPYYAPKMSEILRGFGYTQHNPYTPAIALLLQRPWLKLFYEKKTGISADNSIYEYNQYIYIHQERWNKEQYYSKTARDEEFGPLRHFRKNWNINKRFIEEIILWGRKNNVLVFLIEVTLHPAFHEATRDIADFQGMYTDEISRLQSEYGIEYFDLPALAGIDEDDYYNFGHITAGKQRYTDQLIRSTLDLIARKEHIHGR